MVRDYRYEFLLAGLLIFVAVIPIADQFLGDAGYIAARLGYVATRFGSEGKEAVGR